MGGYSDVTSLVGLPGSNPIYCQALWGATRFNMVPCQIAEFPKILDRQLEPNTAALGIHLETGEPILDGVPKVPPSLLAPIAHPLVLPTLAPAVGCTAQRLVLP